MHVRFRQLKIHSIYRMAGCVANVFSQPLISHSPSQLEAQTEQVLKGCNTRPASTDSFIQHTESFHGTQC